MKRAVKVFAFVLILISSSLFIPSSAPVWAKQKLTYGKSDPFVAIKEGTFYHVPSCNVLLGVETDNKVSFKTKNEAKDAGFEPCPMCCKN